MRTAPLLTVPVTLGLLAFASCRSVHSEGGDVADFVFTGGAVYTLDEAQPWAEAVAVRADRIVYVGDAAGAEAFVGEGTQVIDTVGKTVLPGFVSAHDHLIASNWTADGVQLFEASDKAEVLAMVKAYADAHPEEKIVKGIGWVVGKLGGHPTATELDAAVPDRPAILLDFTIHDAWLNTKALAAANITKDTKDTLPQVTYWVRDQEGNPTGCAIEIQWMQAYIDMGAWDPEVMIPESCEKLFAIAARNGTTTVLVPGVVTPNVKDTHGGMESDFEATMDYLASLDREGELKLRVQALPMFKNAAGDAARFAAFGARMKEKYCGSRIRCDFVKIHPDGNWNAMVSPFIEPYEGTDHRGNFNLQPALIEEVALAANRAGLSVVIHTDGDATARAAIDACEAAINAGFRDLRNSIHHLPWVHPDDFRRIVELDIPINVTPSFTTTFSGQADDSIRLLGRDRVETEMGRYPDLVREGVRISISADVPSTQADMQAPLFCAEGATTLIEPSAAPGASKPWPPTRKPVTVEQAIRAITIDAAWQLRMDEDIGSVEVGKLADLVVLERNPLETAPSDLAEIEVALTMMGGRFTYDRERDAGVDAK